jgi:hypothetical protein
MKNIKTLSSIINDLKQIKKEHGNLYIIYSSDDEGNSFHPVWNSIKPTVVQIDEINSYIDGSDLNFKSKKRPNALIIN